MVGSRHELAGHWGTEEIVCEVLDFLLFLKAKEDKEDLEDAQAALQEAKEVGTTSTSRQAISCFLTS
ncbi:hypothetical protein [Calothrix sp. UHCC 0171]|uniref:hypothetical protein n=1 Tax=Calothrix sp. UHCC 0171 TaxID=3110245 RepID=UPI002B2076A6|nr:hypothetical protein [Calothrix sp. UHCC 0171]MEA5574142.1 hypothetical protein [Calothrix sp. UHCC 0171]